MIEFFEKHAETAGFLVLPVLLVIAAWVTKGKRIEQVGDRVEVKDADQ